MLFRLVIITPAFHIFSSFSIRSFIIFTTYSFIICSAPFARFAARVLAQFVISMLFVFRQFRLPLPFSFRFFRRWLPLFSFAIFVDFSMPFRHFDYFSPPYTPLRLIFSNRAASISLLSSDIER
jgi:hypothetical protein